MWSITDPHCRLPPLQRINICVQLSICMVLCAQWLEQAWQHVDRIYPLSSHVEKWGTMLWLYFRWYKCKQPFRNWYAHLWHHTGTGFFSFSYRSVHYPCAVIHWFNKIGNRPDEDTGMWKVWPSTLPNHSPHFVVIHIDAIYQATHLIPIYGNQTIPHDIQPHHSYDVFCAFYVNKYADHHAFETTG